MFFTVNASNLGPITYLYDTASKNIGLESNGNTFFRIINNESMKQNGFVGQTEGSLSHLQNYPNFQTYLNHFSKDKNCSLTNLLSIEMEGQKDILIKKEVVNCPEITYHALFISLEQFENHSSLNTPHDASELFEQTLKNWSFENFYYIRDSVCLLYTSPSPRDRTRSRMPSSA